LQAGAGLEVVPLCRTDADVGSQVLWWQPAPVLVAAAWASSSPVCQSGHPSEPAHRPVVQVPA